MWCEHTKILDPFQILGGNFVSVVLRNRGEVEFEVLVAHTEFLQHNFFATFTIPRSFPVGTGALAVNGIGIKFDVLSTIDWTRANKLHEGRIFALSALLEIGSSTLDGPFGFYDLGTNASSDRFGVGLGGLLLRNLLHWTEGIGKSELILI